MKIFHGGFREVCEPQIFEARHPKDFGNGFYCTEFQLQAEKWAMRNDTPVVSVFEYDGANGLNTQNFADMTEDWLDFIVHCRRGGTHDFDVVSGAMANDQVWSYVAEFAAGVINREQFWVLAKFKKPTHQIVFCTDNALKKLRFVESYEVKK